MSDKYEQQTVPLLMMIYSNLATAGKICKMDCWWSIWLSIYTVRFGFQISKHALHFCAGLLSPFSLPSLTHCPSGESEGVFQALALFTWFFVLGCHIISLSDDVASLRAHNEEIVVAHGLVSLHWGYHHMLGHAIVQVWTYLAGDRFILASMITVCIYLKREYIFVLSAEKPCPESAGSAAYFQRQI